MLNKIILSSLAGIIYGGILNLNIYTILYFILILSIIALTYFSYKGRIKDILQYVMSFIILIVSFIVCSIYTQISSTNVSYLHYQKANIQVTGLVIDLENRIDKKVLTIKIEEGMDVDTNAALNSDIRYLKIPVSQFSDLKIYEKLKVRGQTTDLYKNIFTQKRPLFLSYETDSFLYNRNLNLNQYHLEIQKVPYELSLSQKFWKYIFNLNLYFTNIIKQNMNEPYASLATGITSGETGNLSKNVKDIFINSGLIHLMVLSWTNVTLVILTVWTLTRRFTIYSRLSLSLFFTWIFILMTGLTAPAVRAGIMGSFALLALSSGRKYGVAPGLLLALFAMSLIDPSALLYSPSLHLSYLACFALFVITPTIENYLKNSFKQNKLENKLNKKINFAEYNFSFSFISLSSLILSMTLTTSIYILGMSGKVSLVGGPATLLAEPLVAMSMLFSFVTILSYHMPPYISDLLVFIFSYLNNLTNKIFLQLAEISANLFPTLQISISKNFVILFYIIFISYFSYIYHKSQK